MKTDFISVTDSAHDSRETGLDDLAPGAVAEVVRVDTGDATGRRLQDLGFLPRTRVRALRRAPLGDPGLYELRGYRLCLRAADARRVRVRIQPGPAAEPPTATPTHDSSPLGDR
jgi:ferrous iron transport protein A